MEESVPIYLEPKFDYVIIKINEDYIKERGSIYEATRRAWKAKLENAMQYKYVLSVNKGVVLEVFEVEQWQECAAEPGRIEFVGHVASGSMANQVKGKMIPEYYCTKGLASPFLYKRELSIYEEPEFDYVIIKINEDYIEERGSVYETTRWAWKAKLENAKKYKYVLSVGKGVVLEVFEVEKWMDSERDPGRIEFVGHVAPDSIAKQVKGKMIPEYYRVKGLASPFLYKKNVEAGAETTEPAADTATAELERLLAEAEKAKAELARIQAEAAKAKAEAEAARAEAEKARAEAEKAKAEAEKAAAPTFKTVKIGSQVWMAENLALTKDRDGNELVLGKDYFYPNGDEKNVAKYGLLYTWDAAMRIAPKGWHLPSDDEWTQLTDYVSGQKEYVCGDNSKNIAKALASTEGWNSADGLYEVGNNPNANNATGFGALPAGFYGNRYNIYRYFGGDAYFWSATENNSDNAYGRCLYSRNVGVYGVNGNKYGGFSVRCLRDN